ncbi:hypothetical protein [Flavobacterium frigoris]|uniref:Uncharacterized protein n=1 Tax=Flavobacterium frigoris (strain PS1) TaxID=1086011 RepID=H7FM30_FLAFP|nr:hypothetical protein [Flavobacterium frigoris]EIA10488.1 hypothetical protein HJ01_00228 [Flavobacterium frigoris PS1]
MYKLKTNEITEKHFKPNIDIKNKAILLPQSITPNQIKENLDSDDLLPRKTISISQI